MSIASPTSCDFPRSLLATEFEHEIFVNRESVVAELNKIDAEFIDHPLELFQNVGRAAEATFSRPHGAASAKDAPKGTAAAAEDTRYPDAVVRICFADVSLLFDEMSIGKREAVKLCNKRFLDHPIAITAADISKSFFPFSDYHGIDCGVIQGCLGQSGGVHTAENDIVLG
jgi:hypothetical protein